MDELISAIKQCMGNTFVMYFKTHGFHWNVEGIHFSQYHEFFGDLYEDLYGAVDPLAEQIRALGSYAPKNLNEIYKYATILESDIVGDTVRDMLVVLERDNLETIATLTKAFNIATKTGKQGLANFLADRLDHHEKHGWMIRASLKGI
jgi:starvation-inducible DNA-binding protein